MLTVDILVEARDGSKHPSVLFTATLNSHPHNKEQSGPNYQWCQDWTHLVSTLSQEAHKEKGTSVHFIFHNKYPKISLCGIEELVKVVVFRDTELIVGFDSKVSKEAI